MLSTIDVISPYLKTTWVVRHQRRNLPLYLKYRDDQLLMTEFSPKSNDFRGSGIFCGGRVQMGHIYIIGDVEILDWILLDAALNGDM